MTHHPSYRIADLEAALEALGSAESQRNEPFCLHSGKDVNSLGSIGPGGGLESPGEAQDV